MLHGKMLATIAVGSICLGSFGSLQASDHLDAPGVVNDGQTDLNDLYAFQSPTNANNTVLIQTVNPFSGESEPAFFGDNRPNSPTTFGTDATYDFRIDNNGDAKPDVTYSTTFSNGPAGNTQSYTVKRTDSSGTTTFASGNTGSALNGSGGGRAQAGQFDDPFFFDEKGFKDGFNFTGKDSFAGANVSAIVLEVPTSQLGADQVAIDATTTDSSGRVDRVGRPAINTALIPKGKKDAYNQGNPATDQSVFSDEVVASINALPGGADAQALANILLPDQLTYDTTKASGFLNGRLLTDDVIDAELALLTNGAVTSDGVDANDVNFPGLFPYLAAPHDLNNGNVVPTPAAVGAGLFLFGFLATQRRRRNA